MSMALYKQTEFAQKCGIPEKSARAYISVNKKRGKIILTSDDMIDDTNPINQAFLQNCLVLAEKRKRSAGAEEVVPDVKPDVKPHTPQPPKPKNEPVNQEILNLSVEKMEQEKEKKALDIEKARRENRILEMQEMKISGKLIPIEPVNMLFAQQVKAFTVSFKQAADLILMEFGKKAKLGRNDMAELRGIMISIINKSVQDGLSESKKGISNIVEEYAQSKLKK